MNENWTIRDEKWCSVSMNHEHCQHFLCDNVPDDEWHHCSSKGRHCCYCDKTPTPGDTHE